MKQTKTLELAQTALLSALIVLLAFVPYIGYIKLPILAIQATTIHIPVIIGSVVLGPKKGAFLGGLFGLTSLINNTTQPGITAFCFSPFIEIGDGMGGSPLALIICFVPRILCGILPYYVYNALQTRAKKKDATRKYPLVAVGVAGSLTNTILVMGMIYIFFGAQYAEARNIAFEAVLGVIFSVVAINGTIEAIIAALISAAVSTALHKSRFTQKA